MQRKSRTRAAAAIMAAVMILLSFQIVALAESGPCPQIGCNRQCEIRRTNATCTSDGAIFYLCPDHGEVRGGIIPAAHKYKDIEGTKKDPACTQKGTVKQRCQDCGDEITKTLSAALGHSLVRVAAKDPGEDTDGNTEYWECERCGEIFLDSDGKVPGNAEDVMIPGHTHTLKVTGAKEPTETTPGNIRFYTCTSCGRYFTDEAARNETTLADVVLPRLEHDLHYNAPKLATEDTPGNIAYYACRRGCGKLFKDADAHEEITLEDTVIPALGHSLEAVARKEPTEDAPGQIAHWRCRGCGKLFADREGTQELTDVSIAALGHTLTHTPGKPATDEEDGILEHWTCEGCQKVFSDGAGKHEITDTRIAALGHDLEHVPAREATEETEGNTAHWRCKRCGKLFADDEAIREISAEDTVIPAAKHVHALEYFPGKAPTDTLEGILEHWKCASCGKMFSDAAAEKEITDIRKAPLGHSLRHVEAKAPDEMTPGNTAYYVCERCGLYFEDADAQKPLDPSAVILELLGHTHTLAAVPQKEPTETEPGVKAHYQCSGCGKLFEDPEAKREMQAAQTILEAAGHRLVKVEGSEPTEDAPGMRTHWKCEGCGRLFADSGGEQEIGDVTLPALGHDLVYREAIEATEEKPGRIAYWECTRCGRLFKDAEGTQEIPAADTILKLEHTHDWKEETTPPACTEGGHTTYTCSGCEKTREETISPLGHTLEKVEAKDPTALEAGNIQHWRCKVCACLFADDEGKVSLTQEDTVLKPQAAPEQTPEMTPAPDPTQLPAPAVSQAPAATSATDSEVPKTDDESSLSAYIWLCTVSAAVAIAMLILLRKKGREK